MNEIDTQIKEIENRLKKMITTRESFEKLDNPNLKNICVYMNLIELNSCGSIDDILTTRDKLKSEIKSLSLYYGEEERNFRPIDMIKTVSDFVRNFKKASL